MTEARKKLFKAGALVYIETDEDSDKVFILEDGEVELGGNPRIKRFRHTLKPGDIFGFTSCLCRRPRMETARAITDSTIVVLDREKFLRLVESNPELALKIISYFAAELRAYDNMIVAPAGGSSTASAGSGLEVIPSGASETDGRESRLFELGESFIRKDRASYAMHVFSSYQKSYPAGIHSKEVKERLAALRHKGIEPAAPFQKGLYKVFSDGEMIFCEHEPGEELYIIKEGKVEIYKSSSGEEILLSVLGEGDIFGELSIVSHKPRSASALAAGGLATLLPITKESLPTVFGRSPAIIARILVAISQRIWFTFIRLHSLLYENPLTRVYVLLENKLLEERISLSGTKSVELSIGLTELLSMAGVPPDRHEGLKAALTDDVNLSFHFRQVSIANPNVLAAKAHFYRTRDHLDIPETEKAVRTPKKRLAGAKLIGLEPQELKVPPEAIP